MPQPVFHDIPDEEFEPEVLREMSILLMDMPAFEAHIKEADLTGIDNRDKKLLLAFSLVEQKLDYALHWQIMGNRYQRRLEAELIRQKKEHEKQRDDQKENKWRWDVVGWLATSLGGALVVVLIDHMFKK